MFIKYNTVNCGNLLEEIAELKNVTYNFEYKCAIIRLRGFMPLVLPMSKEEYSRLVGIVTRHLKDKEDCIEITGVAMNIKECDLSYELEGEKKTVSTIWDNSEQSKIQSNPFMYKIN